jgi:hypothetical protein
MWEGEAVVTTRTAFNLEVLTAGAGGALPLRGGGESLQWAFTMIVLGAALGELNVAPAPYSAGTK